MATTTRIDLRVDEEKKRIIACATKVAGQTVTQYVLALVWPDAQQRIADQTRLRLSPRDWQRFCERLDEPPPDIPELRCLPERPSRFRDAWGGSFWPCPLVVLAG